MSDDPKSTAPRRKPPSSEDLPPFSDPRQMDVPADAYEPEEDQAAPEQEAQTQTDETAESYAGSYLTSAEDEQSLPSEDEEVHAAQEAYETHQQPAYEETPLYQDGPPHDAGPVFDVKSIAPRHTARPAQMRSAPPEEPKDPDSQILALTYQLQELIAQKQSAMSDEENYPGGSKSRRPSFKPMGPPAAMRNPALQLPPDPTLLLPEPVIKPPSGPPSPGMDWTMRAAIGMLVLGLLVGAFLAGRSTSAMGSDARKPRRDAGAYVPSVSIAWSESTISQLDAILAADQTGEMDRAYSMTNDLRAVTKLPIPGLNAYLANLESRRGNYPEAESLLSTSFDQGVLSTNDQFAYSYTRRRDFTKASQWFTRAVIDNPFSAESFYRLGEALRRQGNLQDAVKRFKEALVRLPAESMFDMQREWTALKLRLAMIESGQSADLQPEIDAHLQASPPSGYWMLTAAAVALQGGDELAAAVALGKAKAMLSPEQFNGLLSDYFFRVYATHNQVAPFFMGDSEAAQRKQSSRTAYFIDP